MSLIDGTVRERLRKLYGAPDRHYHDNRHIDDLLGQWEANREQFEDPAAVEAAIWFHDAIYNSRVKDNEAQSAALAGEWLSATVEPEQLARIKRMILATAGHGVPIATGPAESADTALFLDADLSILAAPTRRYDAYELGVRQEYGWIEETVWRARRAEFLRSFLARPQIFTTAIYRNRFEASARANMQRSLKRLES